MIRLALIEDVAKSWASKTRTASHFCKAAPFHTFWDATLSCRVRCSQWGGVVLLQDCSSVCCVGSFCCLDLRCITNWSPNLWTFPCLNIDFLSTIQYLKARNSSCGSNKYSPCCIMLTFGTSYTILNSSSLDWSRVSDCRQKRMLHAWTATSDAEKTHTKHQSEDNHTGKRAFSTYTVGI